MRWSRWIMGHRYVCVAFLEPVNPLLYWRCSKRLTAPGSEARASTSFVLSG